MKNNWKIRFRQLWSSITKENQHLTTERIEALIESLLAEQQHDHEILVNTILEGHKKELQEK